MFLQFTASGIFYRISFSDYSSLHVTAADKSKNCISAAFLVGKTDYLFRDIHWLIFISNVLALHFAIGSRLKSQIFLTILSVKE